MNLATATGTVRAGMAGGGQLRWVSVELRDVVAEARERLDLSPVAAAALGRSLAGAALLMRRAAKPPRRLLLEIRGDGPLGQILAEVGDDGGLRGTVAEPRVWHHTTETGKLDVGAAVGVGMMGVRYEYEQHHHQSRTELISGEIVDDLAHFLFQSEQAQCAIVAGVLTDLHAERLIAAAGGILVEALPGATDEVLAALEANIAKVPAPSRVLAEAGLDMLESMVLAGLHPQHLETQSLIYRCRCSRERFLTQLALLGSEDRATLLEDEQVRVSCNFCGSEYQLDRREIEGN
jgi:molecular chaperone Hsp33